MVVSHDKQQGIQNAVDAASPAERNTMRDGAMSELKRLRSIKDAGANPREYEGDALVAIEVLLRIEATEKNKGTWFRAKRRITLTKEYLVT